MLAQHQIPETSAWVGMYYISTRNGRGCTASISGMRWWIVRAHRALLNSYCLNNYLMAAVDIVTNLASDGR